MPKLWAIVPAAGVGKRMGGDLPKQYLPLGKETVLQVTISRLLAFKSIEHIYVPLGPDDQRGTEILASYPNVSSVEGGGERCFSVLNALKHLANSAEADDWVLVHDAARPCLRASDFYKLLQALESHPVGGLLAAPVADTIKSVNMEGEIDRTVDREGLWRAFTPQIFRYKELFQALTNAVDAGVKVTDEASAIEYAGKKPLAVEGHSDNIKITYPQDIDMAEVFLERISLEEE